MSQYYMSQSYWIHGFWIAELALECLFLLVLLGKKAWRQFPLFVAFSVWSMIGDFGGYALLRYPNQYAYFYFVYETVSVILALAVTYEIFVHLVASHQALRRLATLSLGIACVFLILLGATVVITHSPIGQKGVAAGVLAMEESYRVLEVGLIMSLFLFSGAFGLHWRRRVFGVVIGLGISASIKLAMVTIIPKVYAAAASLNLVILVSYDLSLLIWIAYMLIPERATAPAEVPDRSQLEQWNRAVMELIHQ
jgi:hypothetical protein